MSHRDSGFSEVDEVGEAAVGGERDMTGRPDPRGAGTAMGDESADIGSLVMRADNLTKRFGGRGGRGRGRRVRGAPELPPAVDDVSLEVRGGRTIGVVGESGSGKTTLARMLAGLTEPTAGQVYMHGVSADTLTARRRHLQCQYVFQDPYSSLNPRMRVGQSVEVPLKNLLGLGQAERRRVRNEMLERTGLGPAVAERYPHELSGGQRQRVVLARAMAPRPSVVVLDEPVSALDVSVQAQILALLAELQQALGTGYVFISHDLAVVRSLCSEALVMQEGRVVERGSRAEIFDNPQHEYTRQLLDSVPGQGKIRRAARAAAGAE